MEFVITNTLIPELDDLKEVEVVAVLNKVSIVFIRVVIHYMFCISSLIYNFEKKKILEVGYHFYENITTIIETIDCIFFLNSLCFS